MIADHQNANRAEELRELRMKLLQANVKNNVAVGHRHG